MLSFVLVFSFSYILSVLLLWRVTPTFPEESNTLLILLFFRAYNQALFLQVVFLQTVDNKLFDFYSIHLILSYILSLLCVLGERDSLFMNPSTPITMYHWTRNLKRIFI